MFTRPKIILLVPAFLLTFLWGFSFLLEISGIIFSTYPQAYTIAILLGIAIDYPTFKEPDLRPISLTLLIIYTIAIFTLNLPTFHFSDQARPFLLFYRNIHPGMSLTQVNQTLDRQFPSNGRFPKPICGSRPIAQDKTELSCQLDPNNGNYNAEFITVHFRGDRLTHKNYSPD
jgi:hypothetical protein